MGDAVMTRSMTSRERVHRAIGRKAVDRVPYSFDLTSRIAAMLAQRYGVLEEELPLFLGDDLLYVSGDEIAESSASPGVMLDHFGVLWDRSGKNQTIGDWGTILRYPLPEPGFGGYVFPCGANPGIFAGLDSAVLRKQDRFVVLHMTGLFDICWHLRGFENYMADMAGNEHFAAMLMDKALAYNLDFLNSVPDGVDGVRVGEDWGLQRGLIMGLRLWGKFLKPRLRVLYTAIQQKGFRVMIHSCGDIAELMPDLIELGVEVVHPVQPEAMDVNFLQREYGRDISFYGALGSQSTLVYGGPEDIVGEARNRLAIFKDGGYILGPAGAIPTDARPETVIALTDYAMGLKGAAL